MCRECAFTFSIKILWRVTYYTINKKYAYFEDSLSQCERPAILLLLDGLDDFIKKIQETEHIKWARKAVKLIFLLFHKQVLYGTWVSAIAFYVPVYFMKKLLILTLQTNTIFLLKCKLLYRMVIKVGRDN